MRPVSGKTGSATANNNTKASAQMKSGTASRIEFTPSMMVSPMVRRISVPATATVPPIATAMTSAAMANSKVAGNILSHMIMPALALGLPLAAVIVRILKQSLKEAMLQDYVLLARIKGFRELRLVLQEALRNAIGPALALTGVQFTFLIGGTVIVERIFAYPGIGNLAIDAVINRDFPVIQGLVLLFGVIFILINIGVDAAVAALNPRLRYG